MNIDLIREHDVSKDPWSLGLIPTRLPPRFNEFRGLEHLLTAKSSLLNPTRAESAKDELDLLLSNENEALKPATLMIVLPLLLAAYTWQRSIELLDHRLYRVGTRAMVNPSLKTFKPITLLRQRVVKLHDAPRTIKDGISEEEDQALAKLQTLAQHRLETLDSVFDTLLTQVSALSSRASNEIQLVIGSVTIQVGIIYRQSSI
jgi:hypothetical protein